MQLIGLIIGVAGGLLFGFVSAPLGYIVTIVGCGFITYGALKATDEILSRLVIEKMILRRAMYYRGATKEELDALAPLTNQDLDDSPKMMIVIDKEENN